MEDFIKSNFSSLLINCSTLILIMIINFAEYHNYIILLGLNFC